MRKSPREIDPVEEVRAIRDALAKRCDYDVEKLARLIRSDEAKSTVPLVSHPAKRIERTKRAMRQKRMCP